MPMATKAAAKFTKNKVTQIRAALVQKQSPQKEIANSTPGDMLASCPRVAYLARL